MAKRKGVLTDEQVEQEIQRLQNSEAVKLAVKEHRLKSLRRQYLYQLRQQEKRGKLLLASGINSDNIRSVMFGEEMEEA